MQSGLEVLTCKSEPFKEQGDSSRKYSCLGLDKHLPKMGHLETEHQSLKQKEGQGWYWSSLMSWAINRYLPVTFPCLRSPEPIAADICRSADGPAPPSALFKRFNGAFRKEPSGKELPISLTRWLYTERCPHNVSPPRFSTPSPQTRPVVLEEATAPTPKGSSAETGKNCPPLLVTECISVGLPSKASGRTGCRGWPSQECSR